jgi:hypothetical protein
MIRLAARRSSITASGRQPADRVPQSPESLPAASRRLLERDIDGIEQLEIVLLLHRHADRYWNAEAAADRVALPVAVVRTALEALAGRGFLDVRLTDSIKYRFSPVTDHQRDAFEPIAALWSTARPAIVEALTAKRQALKDFSDAFRFGSGNRRG